jgi:hypothetical protein
MAELHNCMSKDNHEVLKSTKWHQPSMKGKINMMWILLDDYVLDDWF